ncbi:MAG: FixH family protein [Chloroflexi bacterium]|nr:FixH family protein [Chloroflexota bacterium]
MKADHRSVFRAPYRAFCLLALATLLVALAGCGRVQKVAPATDDGLTITMTVEPSPPMIGEGIVVLTVKDASGQPVAGAQVEVEGNMSHAGMMPSFGKAVGSQGGVYRVPIKWTMGGDWYVDVKLTLPDGKIATRRFPVTVK